MGTGLANRDGRNRIRGVSKIGKRGYMVDFSHSTSKSQYLSWPHASHFF